MIYRRRVRKTGYSIRVLTQHIKLEFGTRVLYVPFDLGLGKPFHSLLCVFDRRGSEIVSHVRRRDRETVRRYAVMDAYSEGWNSAAFEFLQEAKKATQAN